MIFVILGTQKFQFNRLLQALDDFKKDNVINEDILAQKGYSDFIPSSYETIDFMDKAIFDQKIEEADLVICHAGTGAIITALKKEKKVITVPRLRQYGEHVDDHQKQIATMFSKLGYLETVTSLEELPEVLDRLYMSSYRRFESTNDLFIEELRKDIEQFARE
ncbi:PssE/Cps14G family polysaccharide biosynthesis glycosyltransferase [Streptococcus suis]